MALYNGTLFQIDQKEMMRYAGLSPKAKEFPEEAIQGAIQEALALADPKGIWQIYPYDPILGIIEGNPPLTLEGHAIRHHLSHSYSVGVLAVTVGEDIEKASAAHFQEGHYVQGLLLDAAATAAVEHLADQVDQLIQKEAARFGQKTVWRFSPGYGDWPITQQQDFCHLIQTEKIGLTVTDHSMLFPRKSVSAIIGLSSCARKPAPNKCQTCSLRTCPFRTVTGCVVPLRN